MKIVDHFVKNSNNEGILFNCLQVLSSFSDVQINTIINPELINKIIEIFRLGQFKLEASCIRVIGTFTCGNEKVVQILINNGVIGMLDEAIQHNKKLIRKEACWAISNLLAGTSLEIEEIFKYNHGTIFKNLFQIISNDDYDVRFFFGF